MYKLSGAVIGGVADFSRSAGLKGKFSEYYTQIIYLVSTYLPTYCYYTEFFCVRSVNSCGNSFVALYASRQYI